MKRAAAVATIVALVCAGAAAALTVHRGTVSIPLGKSGNAIVSCTPPDNLRLMGFLATVNERASLELTGLARSGRRAVVSAVHPERAGKATLTVIAYCGRGPARRQVTSTVTLAPKEQKSATAVCPAGTSVAFGGFRADVGAAPAPEITLNGLERVSARRWRVSAVNLGASGGNLTAIAYCVRGSPRLVTRTRSVSVAYGKTKASTATCPRGRTLALGGFRSTQYTDRFTAIYPASMARTSSRAWTVSGHKYVPIIGKLTAIAYCR